MARHLVTIGPHWPRGPEGRRLAVRLLRHLRRIRDRKSQGNAISRADFTALNVTLDEFYDTTATTGRRLGVQCSRGCSNCCHQMVYGVHSFEVERIGRRVASEGRMESIRRALIEREAVFRSPRNPLPGDPDEDSREEARALDFFAERRPCVFLDAEGACSIHDIRPYACRRFFSLSPPELCTAEGVQRDDYRGLMFEPSEHFDRALEDLSDADHFSAASDRLDAALLEWFEADESA